VCPPLNNLDKMTKIVISSQWPFIRDFASNQGDHLSGKPGNVRDFTKSEVNGREKILSGKVA